jgi:hypothetical protein
MLTMKIIDEAFIQGQLTMSEVEELITIGTYGYFWDII